MTIPNSMNYSKTFNNYCQIALQKECTRLRIPTNSENAFVKFNNLL